MSNKEEGRPFGSRVDGTYSIGKFMSGVRLLGKTTVATVHVTRKGWEKINIKMTCLTLKHGTM